MIRTLFTDGWTVGPKLGAFEGAAAAALTRPVALPHDALRDAARAASVDQGVHSGYTPGGVFEYRKSFDVPHAWRDKTVLLEFEGVYRDAVVTVNGDFAAHHAHGYTPFTVPLDGFLLYGASNTVTVEARAHKDSRWYTGAGIYRPVHLLVADPVHFALDGVGARTRDVDADRAIAELFAEVVNDTRHTRTARVAWQVVDPAGTVIADVSVPHTLSPGETATARARVAVPEPLRWSAEHPHLYEIRATLTDEAEGTPLDEARQTHGIRTLQVDVHHGLRVNGQPVNLRGACIHHDNGLLGAASPDDADDRRIRLLKEAGFNAIRSAHNPAGRGLLDACDRHGVYVMDELTDVWTRAKTTFDHSLRFPDTWRDDVAAVVAKDRAHPSVIMYSIGNEILELGRPIGAAWGRRIAEEFRVLDDTRIITNGINGIIANLDAIAVPDEGDAADPNTMMAEMGEQMAAANASAAIGRSIEESAAVLDVVGFNYADSRYALDARAHPHRVLVGSETFPDRIAALWRDVEAMPHVIGDFTWTGWDYLGEAGIGRVDYTDEPGYTPTGTAGPFPYRLAACGDIDITGHRLPASYYREIAFGLRDDPYVVVHRPAHHGRPTLKTPWSWDDAVASWSWDATPGAPVTVDVYAAADEVELLLDGRSLGVSAVGDERDLIARFETEYRPGELTAIARTGGAEIGRCVLTTAHGAVVVAATAEQDAVATGGLVYVPIRLEDADGIVPCDQDRTVTVSVTGPGQLAGLGTGRARTEETFDATSCTTWDGRALAIIRATGLGEITITVDAGELGSAAVTAVVR